MGLWEVTQNCLFAPQAEFTGTRERTLPSRSVRQWTNPDTIFNRNLNNVLDLNDVFDIKSYELKWINCSRLKWYIWHLKCHNYLIVINCNYVLDLNDVFDIKSYELQWIKCIRLKWYIWHLNCHNYLIVINCNLNYVLGLNDVFDINSYEL